LARSGEHTLLLELESSDKKLCADAGAHHLMDLSTKRLHLHKERILMRLEWCSRSLCEHHSSEAGEHTNSDCSAQEWAFHD